ncbi:hypothetical protein AMATHDRAFT_73587 [Amanita thiersii Skay4041]|uniref:Peptidase A1 domain-containing protein n=1 Tax=Amanita thiersii Skay4041 TaxID=703135 RepID=A0A2A9NVL5_9AGAR|nr:hypothetical protein AMATHDRAFT_73587 [Amanita thiersii Skay4041]
MRSLIPLHLFLTVLDFAAIVYSIRIPFKVHFGNDVTARLRRRASIPVGNAGNAQYVANMTFGSVQAAVLLDTGSSDLWVNFKNQQPTTKDLGKAITLEYAIGKASGNVHSTQVQFGNYSLDDQTFLMVTDTSTFTADIHSQGYDGLFGLGNNDGSMIHKKLKKIDPHMGDTFLSRIFEQNKQTDNYITFLLDRKYDPSDVFKGQLTVSELVSGFEDIAKMPKLDVDKVNRLLKGDQHWQALTDKDNAITGPDGRPIEIDSIVPNAPDGQLVAVFDSGFTFSQVPRDVSDAIYGRVHGAVYDTRYEYWTVPCGQYLNITINFGGKVYPIHPLDTVDDNFHITDANGNRVCIGTFQPITSAFSLLGHYDMILGMNFLRNTYTLLDFGDWIDTESDARATPYIQLLSVTDAEQARKDFIQVRLGGVDTTGDARWSLLPVSQMQHSPVSEEEKKKKYQEMILSRWPYIFVGCFVFVLLLTGFLIWKCCCRRGKDGRRRCVCGRRSKANRLGHVEKGGLPSVALPSTIPASEQDASAQPVYIPLENQMNQAHGRKDKALVATYDEQGRSSTSKAVTPATAYGVEYEHDQGQYPHSYPAGNITPYGQYSSSASQYQLLDREQTPFMGGFPPGLGHDYRSSTHSASYGGYGTYGQQQNGYGGYHNQ